LTISSVFRQMGLFLFCYISILVVNFIVSKHSLTKKSNYEILLYSLFLLAIPQTTLNTNMLFANFFILLSLRRIISLRSFISPEKKLFDAAFWIGIASLFFFWSVLFFVLIFIALLLYTDNKVKHWIIPFAGVLTVFVIAVSVSVIVNDSFFGVFKSLPEVSYDFNRYNTLQFLITTTMLLSFGLWASLFYVKRDRKSTRLNSSHVKISYAVFCLKKKK